MHDEVDGHLLGFEVTNVDDPDAVDTTLVSKIQLFAKFGHGGRVDPTVVPRSTIHIDVIVEAKTSFALTFEVTTLATDIAPVVVAKKKCDVVGHGEACIVVSLHLGEDSPKLWNGIGSAIDVLDDLTLSVDDFAKSLHVLGIVAFAHRHIAIATHSDGDEVVVVLVALHAFTEKLFHAGWVGGKIPRTYLILAVQVFLMGTHHRLVVTGAHHDAHLVGNSWALGVVFVERCCPHGGPEVVGFQAKKQFKDMLIGFRINTSELIGTPSTERGPFVIDEDAAILNFGRRLHETSFLVI